MPVKKSFRIQAYQSAPSESAASGILQLCKDRHDYRDVERAIYNQPDFVFFAKQGKEVIAFCTALLEQDNLEATLSLYVRPDARGQGIAGELLSRTVEQLRKKGYDPNFVSFYPRRDQSLAAFLMHYNMHYLYSDICMLYPPDIPHSPHKLRNSAEIVPYQDSFYPEMVRLRNLGVNDDQRLKKLPQRQLFHEDDSAYRSWMKSQTSNAFVLLVDGQMKGFAMAASDGEVRSIVVDPAERGQGYATALVSCALTRQLQSNRREIYLWVAERNIVARHIYSKLGFRDDEIFDCAFGKPLLY